MSLTGMDLLASSERNASLSQVCPHSCGTVHFVMLVAMLMAVPHERVRLWVDEDSRSGRAEEATMTREETLLERITVDPGIFGGKPIIRGMRFAVEHVLANLAAGTTVDTVEELLDNYPILELEDVHACLLFAHHLLAGDQVYDRIPVRAAS